jgi:monoamine oxidase
MLADPKILIVGAGLAGLVVAYRLQRSGVACDLVESCDRIGGRIQSVPNTFQTGLTSELGGEVFDSHHLACMRLAQSLGLTLVDLWAPHGLETDPIAPEPTEIYYFGGQRISRSEIWADVEPVAASIATDRAKFKTFLKTGQITPELVALDRLSIEAYLALKQVSPRLQKILSLAYTIKYGSEAKQQSCLNFLLYWQYESESANLFGYSDERFCIAGGNQQLPERLIAQLTGQSAHATPKTIQIQTETELEAIQQLADGRYQCSFRQQQTSFETIYDLVVLTLPFSVLRHIRLLVELPPAQRLGINTLNYSSATKLITGYHYKHWEKIEHNNVINNGMAYTDLPLQHLWETCGSVGHSGMGLLTNYRGGEAGLACEVAPDADLLLQDFLTQLEILYPGMTAAHLPRAMLRTGWNQNPYSRGTYAVYSPGQWTSFYGWEGRPCGNLFFAGEHCSQGFQGYMEGACDTAEWVAAQLLARLGRQILAQKQYDYWQRLASDRRSLLWQSGQCAL